MARSARMPARDVRQLPQFQRVQFLGAIANATDIRCPRSVGGGCVIAARLCVLWLAAAAATIPALAADDQAANTIKQDAKTAGHAVSEGAKTVGHTISEDAKKVGHSVSEGAKSAGHAVSENAKKVGHSVSEGAKSAGHTVSEDAKKVGKDTKAAVSHD